MSQHYLVGANMPGYLPEGEVFCHDSAESALMAWNGNVTHALDAVDDEETFLRLDTERNLVTVSDVEAERGASVMVDNTRHYIEECDTCGDTGADCIGDCEEEGGR